MEAQKGEVMRLQNTVNQQKERTDTMILDNSKLQRELDKANAERSQLQHTVQGLQVTADAMQADKVAQASKEARWAEQRLELERQVETLSAEKARLDEAVSMLHVDIGKLQHTSMELNNERQKVYSLQQNISHMEMEIARLQAEKPQVDQMVSSLHVEIGQLKSHRDGLSAEMGQLQRTVHDLNVKLGMMNEKNVHLQTTVDALYREKLSLQGKLTSMGLELETVRASIGKHVSSEQSLFAEKTSMKQMLDDLSRTGIEKEQQLNTVQQENGRLVVARDSLAHENSQLAAKAQKMEAEVTSLRSRILGYQKMVKGMQEESTGLHQRVARLRDENAELVEHAEQPGGRRRGGSVGYAGVGHAAGSPAGRQADSGDGLGSHRSSLPL